MSEKNSLKKFSKQWRKNVHPKRVRILTQLLTDKKLLTDLISLMSEGVFILRFTKLYNNSKNRLFQKRGKEIWLVIYTTRGKGM